jgi:hypothetical protein
MKRRHFLKCIAGSVALPSIIITQQEFPLKFSKYITDWNSGVTISKGDLSVNVQGCDDLRDSHGICATWELVHLLKNQLELTQQEIMQIFAVAHKLRGPHSCCLPPSWQYPNFKDIPYNWV